MGLVLGLGLGLGLAGGAFRAGGARAAVQRVECEDELATHVSAEGHQLVPPPP